jgi:hypothetical protein
VLRGTKDLVQCPLLDEVAEVHHSGAVTLLVYGAEIVRDEKVGSAEFALNVREKVDEQRDAMEEFSMEGSSRAARRYGMASSTG